MEGVRGTTCILGTIPYTKLSDPRIAARLFMISEHELVEKNVLHFDSASTTWAFVDTFHSVRKSTDPPYIYVCVLSFIRQCSSNVYKIGKIWTIWLLLWPIQRSKNDVRSKWHHYLINLRNWLDDFNANPPPIWIVLTERQQYFYILDIQVTFLVQYKWISQLKKKKFETKTIIKVLS